ncbi:xanthine dehydrogenase family protein molybdopterin-binding subunit [Roseateles saccharophilus]|uniref:CO/xanthine dehydrogenase Mo-binding subunit n=1 Tax=Roseateles saccharophilus TaxID=304 RepID=A0A4R3VDS8_ROSSA|nr:molybdopterin cofactor-binding domain-containing protein [Roseateles saccharophilus]MDG0831700.1 xanthine dehydrogenase family protein molybdopterin-binding subunit [Roseateles saccharophilus]TCV00885.1 CO/xanthine dehydrogenase Mo-binding subunit [Roseateles saccharophilus]
MSQTPQATLQTDGPFQLTRRRVIGSGAAAATLLVHELALAFKPPALKLPGARPQPEGTPTQPHMPPGAPDWSAGPGKARFRIDGLAKVTGQKIYARDFRAADMPGWPRAERVAMILRATRPGLAFAGLDLARLAEAGAEPLLTITQTPLAGFPWPQRDLASLNLSLPFSTEGADGVRQLLVPVGAAPQFRGQAVAILVFADANACRRARRALQFEPGVVKTGAPPPPPPQAKAYSPVNYLTRYEAAGVAPFSQVQLGCESDPFAPDSKAQPYNSTARALRERIDATLATPDPAVLQLGGSYSTQVLDPMFMEPEAGLAWLDGAGSGTLHLVLGTQATNGDAGDSLAMFGSGCPIQAKTVVLNSCYPGGGFGGRDVSTFPPLLAVTAALADGPVRIAQDRYEQFQSGLKQLASHIGQRIAVDRRSGRFLAFGSQQVLPSGGQNNYSQFVAMLAAYCGLSGYDIRQAYVDAIAQPSTGVVAGSMRGFGGPQASFAVETLVDEVAVALQRDPIALREINALREGDRTITGAPLTQAMTLREICRRAREQPLWREREAVKARKAREGVRYGVGFALANQAYGTGKDGVMAEVSLDATGRLTVRSNCVDMGNGSATTLAISTAGWLGRNAHDIVMGDVGSFNALDVSTYKGGDWSKPDWTAGFAMSSSACLTAFHQVHVTEQASRVLFETGLLPAAAAIWGVPLAQLQGRTRWEAGRLVAPGLAPLPLHVLAAKVHQAGLTGAAMVHGLYEGAWVSATYDLPAGPPLLLPIDGLSLRAGGQAAWKPLLRQDVIPPNPAAGLYGRSLYAPSGVLVAVEIGPGSFEPRVVAVELMVDAGKVLQPDLLMGQAQGGVAMGIGYALLENLPLEAGGAGDGRWNLDRYHVALSADVPLGRLNITTLPSEEPTAKGIAEAVLCPIAPAIGNAIAHATGKRFRSLPITAADIGRALA